MSEPFLFVSHVSEDRSPAAELVVELERRGVQCWIAPRNVRPGKPYDDEIAEAIDDCAAMLLVFSEHCNESEYIRREITVAGEARKLVIPFRIEDVQPKRGLRIRLADLHWIDGFIAREHAVDAVIRSVSKDTGAWRGSHRTAAAETAAAAPPVAPATAREPAATRPKLPAAQSEPELAPAPASSDKLSPLVREFLQNAEAGDPSAQHQLGALYMRGIDVPRDIKKGLHWYRKAAEQGNLTSQAALGHLYTFYKSDVPNNEEEGFRWYLKAAEQGDPQSQYKIGQMYAYERGVARDDRKAADWYRKAADQGFADGAIELGVMYEHGRGVAKDDELAMAWFAKAAATGSARAEWIVGLRHESGTGVPSDVATAAKWYRKSADQGYAPAQHCLAVLSENGRGVEKDLAGAIAWYRKAAKQYYTGAEEALRRLGVEVRPAV